MGLDIEKVAMLTSMVDKLIQMKRVDNALDESVVEYPPKNEKRRSGKTYWKQAVCCMEFSLRSLRFSLRFSLRSLNLG